MEEFLVIALVFNIIFSFLIADMGKQRQIGYKSLFWISVLLSPIVGLIVALSSPKISSSSPQSVGGDRFKISLDDAKKAEFKGETEKAISLYQDTLYYLDNDYKNLNDKVEKNRQATIADVRGRIERLKSKGE